ncbi:MAG TPA: copper-binding protein [Vicinamibacteria bacterium]|nr:copper-binding protein [Vicinamibacteria bacterium]
MSPSIVSRVLFGLLTAGLGAQPAFAVQAGKRVMGEITGTDFSGTPRTITVRSDDGSVTINIANRTRVDVTASETAYLPNPPQVWDLKAGMWVQFDYNPDFQPALRVISVPPELRPKTRVGPAPNPGAGGETLIKARLQSVDTSRGEFRADVAGRRATFRASNPRMLRGFQEGDLVVLTVSSRDGDEVVTDIRAASLSGRVTRVDRHRGEIAIDAGGRETTYGVDDKRMLEDVRVGDRVRFEFEDRPGGRKVITAMR